MLNLFDLNFKRGIVHTIFEKEAGQEHALLVDSESLISIDENVSYTISERLSKATEKQTKTFKLTIDETSSTSFFGIASEIGLQSEDEFIDSSKRIALLLAQAQTSSRHSGAYLIVLDAESNNTGKRVLIVIKAEMQDALVYYENDLKLIQNLFLSPAQKMFKFCVLYQREPSEIGDLPESYREPDIEWGTILFDEQFRIDSKPAEYFYKDFLGLTTINNAPIQTKRFFDKTEQFVKNYYEDYSKKDEILGKLNDTLMNEANIDIQLDDFINESIEKEELKQQYKNEVASGMPRKFQKDNALIRSNLNNKKISFPNNIKVSGPIDFMEFNVEIIDSEEELRNISTNQSSYTILKITGKPYSNE